MAQGYSFKCKCGYSFTPILGVGYLFPQVYQDLKKSAIAGELGEELKTFFTEHPEGAIDAETVVARCQKCGKYECVTNLSMYLPKDNAEAVVMPFEGEEYVTSWDLRESYELYAKYQHKCKSCGSDMDIIDEEDIRNNGIICPKCGKTIKCDGIIMCD